MNSGRRTWVKFDLVGMTGVGVQPFVLKLLKDALGLHYLVAYLVANSVAIVVCSLINFWTSDRWGFASDSTGTIARPPQRGVGCIR